MRYSEALLILC